MTRRDNVRPEVAVAVFARDGRCIVPVVDPLEPSPCWGYSTLDHVKDSPRLGRRAKSDAAHLVAVCEGHSEPGMRAGRQWNTANRDKERAYLATFTEREAA